MMQSDNAYRSDDWKVRYDELSRCLTENHIDVKSVKNKLVVFQKEKSKMFNLSFDKHYWVSMFLSIPLSFIATYGYMTGGTLGCAFGTSSLVAALMILIMILIKVPE